MSRSDSNSGLSHSDGNMNIHKNTYRVMKIHNKA
jgi:hypothetical protein